MTFIFTRFMSSHINPASVFIIIPVYNEHQALQQMIDELEQKHYCIAVVDDGSAIDVYPLLKNRKFFFLQHDINLGQGAALQTGIEFALSKGADYIVTFDGDGQHKIKDVDNLLNALSETEADIVLGSRFIEHGKQVPLRRRLVLQTARIVNFLFTGFLLSDAHNGLRAMTRYAAEKIQLKENRMAHATEILSLIKKHHLKYVEVPVEIHYTKYSLEKGQTAMNSFRIFFDLLLNKIFK